MPSRKARARNARWSCRSSSVATPTQTHSFGRRRPRRKPGPIEKIAAVSDGFIYAASLLGVTGVRRSLDERAGALVDRIRAVTTLPVALGIGVSTPEHARTVASYADGVIVGSAIVRLTGL